MYLRHVSLVNVGPITSIDFAFRFKGDGSPAPLVIVGKNGAGKTLFLSVILDAMTEGRRLAFNKLPEVEGTGYVKISSKSYVRDNESFALTECNTGDQANGMNFLEVVNRGSYASFQQTRSDLVGRFAGTFNQFDETGFYKHAELTGTAKGDIQRTNFLFFPNFRYEKSAWMSENTKIDFAKSDNFVGIAKVNPLRTNIVETTRNWLLNCLLDREIYERVTAPGLQPNHQIFIEYNGPNTNSINVVQAILLAMFKSKDPSFENVRIGIGRKENREFAVVGKRHGSKEFSLAPDISMLSSGELMVLALASEILRAWEVTNGQSATSTLNVDGIVVIDEIDLHLHITAQRDILPIIIGMFPKVQFIISTHSPFFIIGLKQDIDFDLIELPLGQRIEAEQFSEFQEGYDIYVEKENQFKTRFESLSDAVRADTVPLVITEGKTDWQHLKIALDYAKEKLRFSSLKLRFLEFTDDVQMGDTRLKQMCEAFANVKQDRKVIFVFDRDNPRIVSEMAGGEAGYRDFGNNVYSMCIPTPMHRIGYEKIAIEHLYQDFDLKTCDPKSGRRMWFTNEIKIISEPGSDEKRLVAQATPNSKTELKKQVYDKEASQIINEEGAFVGLSKAAFLQAIVADPAISSSFDRSALESVIAQIEKIVSI